MCLTPKSEAEWSWPTLDEFCRLPHECKISVYASLMEENARLQDELSGVDRALQSDKGDEKPLAEQIEALRATVEEIKSTSEAHGKEIATLTANSHTVDDYLDDLQASVGRHEDLIVDIDSDVDECRDDIRQLEQDVANHATSFTELRRRCELLAHRPAAQS